MTKLIIANWKSHKSVKAVPTWFEEFHAGLSELSSQGVVSAGAAVETQVVIAPSFPSLAAVNQHLTAYQMGVSVALAVQDVSPFPAGKYTGAVSMQNLEGLPVEYAIVGHSERRRYFHESHVDVAMKVELALASGVTPIVCVDEEYVADQAAAIAPELVAQCIVAYEPLSAIGTGNSVAVDQVVRVKDLVVKSFGEVPFIYGGSVDETNAREYFLVCDGALVATASLAGGQFAKVVACAHSS